MAWLYKDFIEPPKQVRELCQDCKTADAQSSKTIMKG